MNCTDLPGFDNSEPPIFSREDLENYRDATTFWKCGRGLFFYLPEQFERTVQQNPLTFNNIEKVLERSSVRFDYFESLCYPDAAPLTFRIAISKDLSLEETAQHLLHEVIHCYYRTKGGMISDDKIEALIDKVAEEFYLNHKGRMDVLVGKLLQNWRENEQRD